MLHRRRRVSIVLLNGEIYNRLGVVVDVVCGGPCVLVRDPVDSMRDVGDGSSGAGCRKEAGRWDVTAASRCPSVASSCAAPALHPPGSSVFYRPALGELHRRGFFLFQIWAECFLLGPDH